MRVHHCVHMCVYHCIHVCPSLCTCVSIIVYMCVHHCVHVCCVLLSDAAQSSDSAGVARKREAGVWYNITTVVYLKFINEVGIDKKY